MEKTDTGYNVETEDNGVLHFVIGCEYSGESRHIDSYLKRVTGKLRHSKKWGLYIVADDGTYIIHENTLRYL